MGQAAFKMDDLIPNPPPPTAAEVDAAVMHFSQNKISPEFQDTVAKMLYAERTAAGWMASAQNVSEMLKDASARDLDTAIIAFANIVKRLNVEFTPLIDRANSVIADLDNKPASYRASFGESWRRMQIALSTSLKYATEVLRTAGAEKAERFPEEFIATQSETQKDNEQANKNAAMTYKYFADRIFGVECMPDAEDIDGERFYFVKVPVPADMVKPHRVFAEQEEQIQKMVQEIFPDFVGRAYLRYVRVPNAS